MVLMFPRLSVCKECKCTDTKKINDKHVRLFKAIYAPYESLSTHGRIISTF